jgi:hypothetical protein
MKPADVISEPPFSGYGCQQDMISSNLVDNPPEPVIEAGILFIR